MSTDVIIEDDRWEAVGLNALAVRAVDVTLAHFGLETQAYDVVVMACDDARIAALNTAFRDKDSATNVLSWPSAERGAETEGVAPELPQVGKELGDLAISFDTCQREATGAGRDLADHTLHLLVHATLHLLGYDHVRARDGDLMEATEIAILDKLGVQNPYEG